MHPFRSVAATAIPFPRENVDTDVIIRIERLTDVAKDDLGPYAFEALKQRPDGSTDPDCVFNQPAYAGAPILIAGANFGCGSSREGAVWALAARGIRTVIAPSFGGIFMSNCYQNGVLPVVLPQAQVDELIAIAEADPTAPITVDLERQVVVPPNGAPMPFEIDALRRDALLQGLDMLGLTLTRTADIDAFEGRDATDRTWIYGTHADQPPA